MSLRISWGHSDVKFQDKCLQTLRKLTELELEVSQKPHKSSQVNPSSALASSSTTSPSSLQPQHVFPDAEMVIRGRDGKNMFFKKRLRGDVLSSDNDDSPSVELVAAPRLSALVVPHPTPSPDNDSPERHQVASTVLRQRRISLGISRQQWPMSLLLLITRIQSRLAIVRIDEDDESDVLVINVYSPSTSLVSTLKISFSSLGFVLPASLVWYRTSEVREFISIKNQVFSWQSAHH